MEMWRILGVDGYEIFYSCFFLLETSHFSTYKGRIYRFLYRFVHWEARKETKCKLFFFLVNSTSGWGQFLNIDNVYSILVYIK